MDRDPMDRDYLIARLYAECRDCGRVHATEDELQARAHIVRQVRNAVRNGEVTTASAVQALVDEVRFTRPAAHTFVSKQKS